MRAYYLLLYKVWRIMQWSRQRMRFRWRESLTEATASIMVFVWSNWVLVGILTLLKIPYFGNSVKSAITEFCFVAVGLVGFTLIYWLHLRLIKSTSYQACAATFPIYSQPNNLLVNFLSLALLLSLYISPWLAAKWLLN